MSLADPNLMRLINRSADCRALVVATPGSLASEDQGIRLEMLERYYNGLGIRTVAIEAYEEVPAFLLELRRQVAVISGTSLADAGVSAFAYGARRIPADWNTRTSWAAIREWRNALKDAVGAAKRLVPSLSGDASLRAGLYLVDEQGMLTHVVHSELPPVSVWRSSPKAPFG